MRWVSIPIAAFLALLAACQQSPEPFRARSIKQNVPPPNARCVTDFWGNCTQAVPPPSATCVMDFWGNCTRVSEKRHSYRWRYVRPGNRPPEDLSPVKSRGLCQRRLRTVGDEGRSQEDALAAAQRAWMGTVRFDYGERFMDLATAQDARHSCVPSSTGTVLKGNMFRCVLEATPAARRGPVNRGSRIASRCSASGMTDGEETGGTRMMRAGVVRAASKDGQLVPSRGRRSL